MRKIGLSSGGADLKTKKGARYQGASLAESLKGGRRATSD